MFQLGKAIVSEDVLEKEFVCNLNACKGACCVAGEAGAPLEEQELVELRDNFEKIRPYLEERGLQAIKEQGLFTTNELGEYETPLIHGNECAYLVYDERNRALCGIEQAFNDGAVEFKKPISCHLYPVRIRQYSEFAAVNYHKWEICDDACTLGKELKVPIFKFVKEALSRKFGEKWYRELEEVARKMKSKQID
ncbi:MAG: DUF3109 family protein [Lutimonas sp.]